MLDWALGEGDLLSGWPIIEKVWLGIVCAGCLAACYRVNKGREWDWRQRLRLAPIAFLAYLLFVVGTLVLQAFHLVD